MFMGTRFILLFIFLLLSIFRYVFVVLGGNNIDKTTKPREIYMDLVAMADELKLCGVKRVFVCGIIERGQFPSWTDMTRTVFNKVRR